MSALEDYLRTMDKFYSEHMNIKNDGWVYRNHYDFLLQEGRAFTEVDLAEDHLRGEARMCFNNSLRATWENYDLFYVEGVASGRAAIPVDHAWVTENGTLALECTWEWQDGDYFGVIFDPDWVASWVDEFDTAGVLADDFGEKKVPILRDGLPEHAIVRSL